MSNHVQESVVTYENGAEEIPVQVIEKPKHAEKALADRLEEVMKEGRFWATTAHAMGPAMIALLIFGDGIAWLGLMLVTGAIYLYFQDKDAWVTMHARQALAVQFLGTFGWIALLLGGTALWVVALVFSILLIVLLVGIILTPLVAIAYPIFLLASFGLPFGVVVFGALGAWQTWHGVDFRYPYVADWLDRRLGSAKAKRQVTVV